MRADAPERVGLCEAAGHLAMWVGLYFAAAYASAVLLLGGALAWAPLAGCFCAGIGLYLLDRVKPQDSWLDPADLESFEARHRFLRARRRSIRLLAWLSLALGTLLVMLEHPVNGILAPIGIAGVLVYGGQQHGRGVRPKDMLVLKNLVPGVAIATLATVLAAQAPGAGHETWRLGGVVMVLVTLVASDAILCDLDDIRADVASGTRTLPGRVGADAAWRTAYLMHIIAGIGALTITIGEERSRPIGVWVLANLIATAALWRARRETVRDLVDLKLPLVTAAAYALGWAF